MFVLLILPFIYLLLRWYYYYGEGTTEALLWKISKPHSAEFSENYHKFRELVENMGHRLLVVCMAVVVWGWQGLLIWLGSELSGICIYELKFRHIKYDGDWKYQKDGYYRIPVFGKIVKIRYPSAAAMIFIGMFGFIIFAVTVRIMNF